ncbi:hypothetical protein [Phenylobacterium sp.]|uniref:TlpA family protein disulfide reductase n=1 Tax=Phenylobacterium sp. TaxID=1871053 RepID=UPI0025F35B41|nr:hypothetical protein [Phenylobacterium sp.]
MRRRLSGAVAALAAVVLPLCSAQAATPPLHFQVTDLNGVTTQVPAGLPQARALLLLGFRHDDRASLDAWRRGLGLRAEDRDWFETPVIGVSAPMIRGMIVHGMQGDVKDPAERAHLAPAFTNPAAVAAQLGVDPAAPAAVVVDREGRVLARASGPFDPRKADTLVRALRP